jgi:2-amino-4-hydroxy-6-hydroxymethyldihydropteridine diphosphokinase
LKDLKKIERSLGRPEDHPRNVSRQIDIDLLYAGDRKIDNEQLHVPHPRMHLRRFVLEPLAEIRPDLLLPNQTQTVAQLVENLHDSATVVRLKDQW